MHLYNFGDMISIKEGHLIFHNYNEISCNSANSAISASVIHIQENTTLQLKLNTFKNPALNS